MGDPESPSSPLLQWLDPAPHEELLSSLENGEYIPKSQTDVPCAEQNGRETVAQIQKYSTYPPSIFLGLHLVNTSLIPLATRSVAASETYLLLTRPIYQAPVLEPVLLTAPILAHIASGVALRFVRQSRRARLYGAETRQQRKALKAANLPSVQARLGYLLIPFIGVHVLLNRIGPWYVDGGSSSVGLGYVAHGFARSPWTMGVWYTGLVGIGVWHFVGGCAQWMGWREVVGLNREKEKRLGATAGYLGNAKQIEALRRRKWRTWVILGATLAGATLWLAGGLGVVGREGLGSGWEAKTWDSIYSQIPLLGPYLAG
ncbi:hypothetical protein PRK78_004931 [Emydomyces testavorans]|uniref:Mitochondrial adapter protein MCP1 transmembrane domain-containing protein n=1 Tax=Emydomyces testavorans TaxID=2070801 RepID=A0AAF0IK17_9EURO|nr:hypothetical protein PRK78_004931 [Emydomyces testavorans]